MKKNRITLIIIACLVALTAVLAVVHQTTRTQDVEGAVLVEYRGERITVAFSDLPLTRIQGSITNNKGETTEIDGDGILLMDVVAAAGINIAEVGTVQVISSDEYSAEITAAELLEVGKVCLIVEEGSARAVVFGDVGAKRSVRDVARISVNEG